jgi:hypothetical protein
MCVCVRVCVRQCYEDRIAHIHIYIYIYIYKRILKAQDIDHFLSNEQFMSKICCSSIVFDKWTISSLNITSSVVFLRTNQQVYSSSIIDYYQSTCLPCEHERIIIGWQTGAHLPIFISIYYLFRFASTWNKGNERVCCFGLLYYRRFQRIERQWRILWKNWFIN